MNIRMYIALCAVALFFSACKKYPGEGGNATITGKVSKQVRVVLTNPATYQYTAPAADEDVFIIYGDHLSPDDRVWTNYKGEYEFLGLRKGKYTIYVYSRDTTGALGVDPSKMVVMRQIEIKERNQTVRMPELTVYDKP